MNKTIISLSMLLAVASFETVLGAQDQSKVSKYGYPVVARAKAHKAESRRPSESFGLKTALADSAVVTVKTGEYIPEVDGSVENSKSMRSTGRKIFNQELQNSEQKAKAALEDLMRIRENRRELKEGDVMDPAAEADSDFKAKDQHEKLFGRVVLREKEISGLVPGIRRYNDRRKRASEKKRALPEKDGLRVLSAKGTAVGERDVEVLGYEQDGVDFNMEPEQDKFIPTKNAQELGIGNFKEGEVLVDGTIEKGVDGQRDELFEQKSKA